MSDALYDGPNRVIIDDNTPETNSLPVSGGKGVDEFLITRTANSVVIDDDSEANVIVFERDVVITSIERPAGSEGASVAQYVITLSSGKTITLRNPASFTFQHLGDATRTDPISAEDFVTAYEDGFAASDASHPDIIGDASGPSGVQGPMITGTATGSVYEGDLSTSGDLDVNDDTLLASTTPFTISTQGTYGTASIGDDGEWVYKLDNGHADVRALNSGDTLTDTFVVDVNPASGRAETQTVTITISGRTDVLGTNGLESLGDANTSDNQAIFGFNFPDNLIGGSGDDLLVGGYGVDDIDLSAGGTDTVVYRINSSDPDGLVKAEDGADRVMEFTPGEDKLVILDVNGSPTTLAGLFDSLTKDAFRLGTFGNDDGDRHLSSSELDAGARTYIEIRFQADGTVDGGPTSAGAGRQLQINFDRVTSEALNDRAVWDTLTGGTNFSSDTISTVAQLNSLFGGFGRPGYDAALDDGGFISIIGPDDLPSTYFEIVPISGDETGSVTEGGAPGDDNTGTLTASGAVITLVSKEITDSPGTSTGTYGVMTFDGTTWTYTLDDRAEALADQQTATETFTFSAVRETFEVTITVTGANDAPVVESGNEIVQQAGRVGQEITAIDLSGLFTDVDTGDTFTLTVMVLSSDGSTKSGLDTLGLGYDSGTKMITGTLLNSVAAGPYTIEVIATDGSGGESQPSTFDIVVAPDIAPVIGGAVDGTIAEDAADPVTGTLTITDAEGDPLPTVMLSDGAGQYGTLTFVASAEGGVWTYTLNNANAAVQALGDGEVLTETFTFTANGAAPITVTITITGANDAPTVSGEFFTRVGPTGGQFILTNLSDQFTDVDEGDELTFTVTLDDGAALSTIGLTYDSDEDEITGTLTETGTYVIKIVATDKIGATVEATFDLNILAAIPIIQRNSLTYNPDATSITIDETMLEVTSGNESDPALLVYTITTLPDAGMLLKSGTPLNNGDTFTQADINNGLITYVPSVSSPYTSQSNPLSFTISDGVATLEEQTLEITSREIVGNTAYKGDLSTSGDLDVNDDTLLDSTTPFTISTQGTYGTASIDDDGEWVYKLDYGNTDVRALNSGDTLTDTFVVDVNLASGRAETQTVTITISGRTDVFGTNGDDSNLGDASTSDNQAIFGFNNPAKTLQDGDTLTGGSGDDLLVGGYGRDTIDLSAGGTDTVVYRINSSDGDGLVKAEDGEDWVIEFTPGEDKLVILDVNESPTTLAGLFDSLSNVHPAYLGIGGDADSSGDLSSSELDAGARYYIRIVFLADGTVDGGPTSAGAGRQLQINFDRVTSEALNDRAVLDTLTGGSRINAILDVAQLSSLFGGFGRPGYDAALDDGGFISIIGPDDLLDSYFEIIAVYEGDLSTSGDLDVNDDTLLASTTPFTISTQGTYGTASIGDDDEWVYTLDNGNADVRALNSGDTLTDTFVVDVNLASGRAKTQIVTITISGRTDVLGTNGRDNRNDSGSDLGDASTSDNQAIFGFNSRDTLTGGSGDDLLVGGYGADRIDLSAGGTDTVVYRINSSYIQGGARLVKAEDGTDTVFEFTPGEDKLVILDVNGSPMTLAGFFDSLTKHRFQLRISRDDDRSGDLSSSELDAGARYGIEIDFHASGTVDGDPASTRAGSMLQIFFDRVTSEALNDRAVWDTLTGGTNFSENTISTVAQLSSLFGGFGRPGYDAALDDGGFISIIGPDDLPDSYFISVLNVDTSGSDIVGAVYEGDPSTSGDLDVSDDTLLASTTPFTISTQGTYGTASIDDDGEWVYKLDNGNTDVRALNSGDTLTDTFVVNVTADDDSAQTQTITITISGRTDVFGTNGDDSNLGDASTSDNQAIFGFNAGNGIFINDLLTGGSGDDLLVGGYGRDFISLGAGGTDTVVYRINSSDPDGLVKAEDGRDTVIEFTPGEDKLVMLDVNESPTTLAGLFDSLTKDAFQLMRLGDIDGDRNLSSSELDDEARVYIEIRFQADGTGPTSGGAGLVLRIEFDRVTSEALNDRAVWNTLTGSTDFSENTISTVAQLSSLFGGFGRPGYDAALDDGGFISIIGPDDLPDSYFEIISGDETGSVTEDGAPGDDNTGTLTAPSHTITLVSKEITDSPGTSTGTYGVMRFNASSGEWVYTLDDRAEALADQQTATETFIFSAGDPTFEVTITITGANDAPVVESGNEIGEQAGRVGQEIEAIDLSGLFTDVDTGDTFTLTVMVLSSDGNTRTALDTLGLEYDSDTKMITGTLLNSVAAGPYTIEVIATDDGGDESQPSTFDIVVAPDIAPVIGGDVDGTIAEDAADPLMGTLTITDAEGDPLPTVMLSDGAGQYGTLTFVASAEGGVWTYTLNNANAAVQALGKDDTLTDDFTFTAEGAAPITVTITISGVNDAPELVSGAEIEDQDGNVGQLIDPISESDLRARFVDADTDNAALVLTVMVLASDGTRSGLDTIGLGYNSTDGITGTPSAAGTYTIEVTASDGEESIAFTFDIVVVHPPVIGNDSPTEIGEDAGSPITGRLTITDQDSSAPFRPIALTDDSDGTDDGIVKGEYGTLTFDSNTGAWSYMVDERAQALNDDTPGTDRFVFTSEGATDFELVITVTGTNDDPAIAMVDDGSGTGTLVSASIGDQSGTEGEDTIIDLSGVFIDPDDVLNVVPTATLDSDGTAVVFDGTNNSFSYDPDTEMLTINLADIGEYTISVEATDGGTGPAVTSEFTFTVVEQQISGDSEGSVTEDDPGNTPAMGTLTRSNASTSLELTGEGVMNDGAGTFTREGKYGTMTFVASASGGDWSYVLDNTHVDVQGLGVGETLTETFVFTTTGVSSDFTVTITIEGANDAPVLARSQGTIEGQTGQTLESINLLDLFNDPDGDELELTVTATFNESAISLDDAGFTHTINDEDQTQTFSGAPQAEGTYVITVVAEDEGGATATSTFTINAISGTRPLLRPLSAPQPPLNEDDPPITGRLVIYDEERDPLPDIVIENADVSGVFRGLYGSVSIEKTGETDAGRAGSEIWEWTYTLDERAQALGVFKEGDPIPFESFSFIPEGVPGAANAQIEIRIVGANDVPMVSGEFFNREGTTGGQFTLNNLSDQFTDVDEGDELTFEVTLDDDRPLSTIGLTYDSDEDEITGTLTEAGTYVIKIVATDKSGTTVEATFDLSIVPAIPEIQRSSLTYNPDETSITIDETILKVTSGNESDPALLVYTITTLPDAGKLLKSGTQLNDGDTFTQADINNGLITYVPNVSSPSTSQSNPLSFTFSDGVETLEEQTLQITSREVFVDETPAEDNTIDRSGEAAPQKIEAGDGSDTITGGDGNDQIDGGAGDDEIKLTRTVGDVEEDAGADEVLYTFSYDGVGIDGGDEIVGFKRGQDKLTFVVDRNFDSLTEFLQSLNGADDEDLTDDDAFIVTMVWGLDTDGDFYFDGVLLHFKEGTSFGGGRIFSPVVQITFDERLGLHDLIEILGGAENVANNFDGGLTAFKNLDEVLPRLFGEGSIGFKVVAPPSDTSGASERASEEPLEPPIYETLSEQLDDDLQPTSFELGGGETDII